MKIYDYEDRNGYKIPTHWSVNAGNILVNKYMRKAGVADNFETVPEEGIPKWLYRCIPSTKEPVVFGGETAATDVFSRLCHAWLYWAFRYKYLSDEEEGRAIYDALFDDLYHQRAAPNSPQWFNTGLWHAYGIEGNDQGNYRADHETGKVIRCTNAYEYPQTSACFINGVSDSLMDPGGIMDLWAREARLFKGGSGSGANYSRLRAAGEPLSGGGVSSGMMSFLDVGDTNAGAIKSGGTNRRAARNVVVDADHPDVVRFIGWKAREEKKAAALIAEGYDGDWQGEAYQTIQGQNANNNIMVDARAIIDDEVIEQTRRTDGKVVGEIKGRELLRKVAEANHACGDPNLMFCDTVNKWHTIPHVGPIRGSNPCVTGDTLVSTTRGLRRIDSMIEDASLIVCGDGEARLISPAFATGEKEVFRLHTKEGYSLKLTADHLVMTQRGDVAASSLRKGDRIELGGVRFGVGHLGEEMATLIGLFLGDGCISAGGNCVLTLDASERVLTEIAQRSMSELRGDDVIPHEYQQGVSRLNSSAACVRGPLSEYAVLDALSDGKAITPKGMSMDRASTAAMLRGLFSTDGTVADYGDKSNYVSLGSTSIRMLQQVQLLLLGYGIKSKIYENRNQGGGPRMLPDGKGGQKEYITKPSHDLRISRSSRHVFEREVGFIDGTRKAESLSKLNERRAYRDRMSAEFVRLEPIGVETVYDLTEPVTQHFVANGFVVHNCNEYLSIDDTACNLASLNLVKFFGDGGLTPENLEAFRFAVKRWTFVLELTVAGSSYPSEAIARNTWRIRNLGLGYANLGGLLMGLGIAYDSDEGRAMAARITSEMSAAAWAESSYLAVTMGAYADYHHGNHRAVMSMHMDHAVKAGYGEVWADVMLAANETGYRNAQGSLLAPCGTIGLLMDCDSTGIETPFSLKTIKSLAGGGTMELSVECAERGLVALGYEHTLDAHRDAIVETGEPRWAGLMAEHEAVFACASGSRALSADAHLNMMAAVQPFLSGGISKTVNLPNSATVEDIEATFLKAAQLGLKAVAVYRDGCKASQPLTTTKAETRSEVIVPKRQPVPRPAHGLTHKLSVDGHTIFLTINFYADGRIAEVFAGHSKNGGIIGGLINALAIQVSMGLQHGLPVEVITKNMLDTKFEPAGFVTGHPSIRFCSSISDLIARVLIDESGGGTDGVEPPPSFERVTATGFLDIACPSCGALTMVRNGTCMLCKSCGSTTGCS